MRRITLSERRRRTGRWVRDAAEQGPLIITERGRPTAALQPDVPKLVGRLLPDRERGIRARGRIAADSGVLLGEDRSGR